MGTGLGHYIPLVVYLGFWVMILRSLTGRPDLGLYYSLPFMPYRSLRDHFSAYPLGANMLSILILAVILGALLKGKRLPASKLYWIWLLYGAYLYFSMWFGVMISDAPAPLWLSDPNFVTWKDYMVTPLVFVAAGLVIEDRKAVRTTVMVTAFSLLAIDRSSLMDSLSRSWANFDENKRDGGPLVIGSNEQAAFLAQLSMFFWGFGQFLKKRRKILAYALTGVTLFATMYTFSRGAYLAIILSVFVLGLLKDRKLLVIAAVFLVVWQAIVPTAVVQRVQMTHNANGQLEASAQERVNLWEDAEKSILADPIFGDGYATYQLTRHSAGLRDTHNWYVRILVETGVVGMLFALVLLQQVFALAYRLFRRSTDPLYRGLGLGLFVALVSSVVANCFGDRWTYLEINGLLWVLTGAAVRASHLLEEETVEEPVQVRDETMPLYLQTHFR